MLVGVVGGGSGVIEVVEAVDGSGGKERKCDLVGKRDVFSAENWNT